MGVQLGVEPGRLKATGRTRTSATPPVPPEDLAGSGQGQPDTLPQASAMITYFAAALGQGLAYAAADRRLRWFAGGEDSVGWQRCGIREIYR
jgi:hypothetical protein